MESPSGYGAARAYQLEMLDHSLERNVIVAVSIPIFEQCSVDVLTTEADGYR